MQFTWKRLAGALAVVSALALAQGPPDDDAIWRAFLEWYKAAPTAGNPIDAHAESLKAAGVTEPEVRRRMGAILRLIGVRSDFIEIHFDKVYARPVTGNPARDGFASTPSAFLVSAIDGAAPGRALDAGMGQGRNAVELARRGWSVAGFDISAEAVAAAQRNARAANVKIEAVKASYGSFDFGTARWDLIVLEFAWAPVTDPVFVSKLHASLRPGGRVVFEHFLEDPEYPRPAAMFVLKQGQLRELFSRFRIDRYEELEGVGDWGGPGSRLVRMVATKAAT